LPERGWSDGGLPNIAEQDKYEVKRESLAEEQYSIKLIIIIVIIIIINIINIIK